MARILEGESIWRGAVLPAHITVCRADSDEVVVRTFTQPDGRWEVMVPEDGEYDVRVEYVPGYALDGQKVRTVRWRTNR